MSLEYDLYLSQHRSNVTRAAQWIMNRIDPIVLHDILPNLDPMMVMVQLNTHDASKESPEEYAPYDTHFYGDAELKETVGSEESFELAFLHHLHQNPHHWQHWIILFDDGKNSGFSGPHIDGTSAMVHAFDMPDNYILEMIADWWSFSWSNAIREKEQNKPWFDDLYEIFGWYKYHENTIIFSDATRIKVNRLLDVIRMALDLERDKFKYPEEYGEKLPFDLGLRDD